MKKKVGFGKRVKSSAGHQHIIGSICFRRLKHGIATKSRQFRKYLSESRATHLETQDTGLEGKVLGNVCQALIDVYENMFLLDSVM